MGAQLTFARGKLTLQQQKLPPVSYANSSGHEMDARIRDSPLWITEPRIASTKHGLEPIAFPGVQPSQQWTHNIVQYYNLDQIANEMPHLHPVSTPHNVGTMTPWQGRMCESLLEIKKKHGYVSNWFATLSEARKLGLLLKKGQVAHRVQRSFLTKVFHISQLSNAPELLTIPFSITGAPVPFPPLTNEVAFRERLGYTGPHLFVGKRLVTNGERMMRPKPNAREIVVPFNGARTFAMQQMPQETESGGGGGEVPPGPIASSLSYQSVRMTHYYNIADVRFPDSFALADAVSSFEAQNPCVPVDGISGEPLTVDSLINLPNIDRCVWFTAAQLLHLGARCGVNAVPVLVPETKTALSDSVWFHVNDLEDPQTALSYVGKM